MEETEIYDNGDMYSPYDMLVDLVKLPGWIWRRIRPASGVVVDMEIAPANLGHSWAVKKALVENRNKERRWINCEVNPSSNMEIGMRVKRRFCGRLFYEEPYKKTYIEIF